MWMWIGFIAFAVVVVLAAKMLDRRGSRGASRADDLPGVEYTRRDGSGGNSTSAGGDGGM